MPKLYLVATPIGNLEDISKRALRILGEVHLVAAEDTRRTRHLLSANNIKTPLTSYHEHNKRSKLPMLLKRLELEDVALVSEAGMPGISDPGYELVMGAIEHGINIVPVPGPSVLPTALAISGLPTNQFTYLGFLPRRKSERKSAIEAVQAEPRTLVVFESPHRLLDSLKDLLDILGDRRITVCRELTKLHEEVFRGTIDQAIAHFMQPRGEFTLIISGSNKITAVKRTEDIPLEDRVIKLRAHGLTARDAVTKLTEETNLPRKTIYKAWLNSK